MSKKLLPDLESTPLIFPSQQLPELTLKALVLGSLLTVVLAAANAYLGLKVGTTISASIPAAVISMGILRFFRRSNVLENTMIQTMASVGEALTAGIAFTLPALIILHVWEGFNYWLTVAIGLLGGTLGVLFTVPLRRALLQDKTLRYPEGVAIGNLFKASTDKDKEGLQSLTLGGGVGAVIALCQTGFQILADSYALWFRSASTIFGFGVGLSPALIAAGYIVGINVAISVFVGVIFGWILGIPVLTTIYGTPQASTTADMAIEVWHTYVRYIGVGTMLVGSLWTIITLAKPVLNSLKTSFTSLTQAKLSGPYQIKRTQWDIPINYVFWGTLGLLIPLFFLIAYVIIPHSLGLTKSFTFLLAGISTLYILLVGFIICSTAAYFAGLIGSTNSPLSGLLVCVLLILALILMGVLSLQGTDQPVVGKELLGAAVAVGVTVIMGGAAVISNETMQDLKVGEIVGATPWKQQVILMLGVAISAFVIPPILELLYNAYGIGGVFPRPNMDASQTLAAPQAGLMAAVAQGAFNHQLPWAMIITGSVIAVFCIIIDEIAKKRGTRFPVLAVGLGIYLPLASSMPVVIGGVLSYLINRKLKAMQIQQNSESVTRIAMCQHRGLVFACGIVAGASLMGVVLAIPFAIRQSSDALKIMPNGYASVTEVLGIIVTLGLCVWMYRFVVKK